MMLTGGKQPRNVIFAALGRCKVYASRSSLSSETSRSQRRFGRRRVHCNEDSHQTTERLSVDCSLYQDPMAWLSEGTHAPFRLPQRGAVWLRRGAADCGACELMLMAFVVVSALATVKAQLA